MVFSSLLFLFGFLPAIYLLYLVVHFGVVHFGAARFGAAPRRAACGDLRSAAKATNAVLLLGSLLFYAWGAPKFILLFLIPGVFDFAISRLIARDSSSPSMRRTLLWISIAGNLAILGYFKYANFFIDQLNALLAGAGAGGSIAWTTVALPIGISFITFEKISYIVDVYNRRVPPAESIVEYLLFIALFPHLIAGPIFRYHDIAPQLAVRSLDLSSVWAGMIRFCYGLSKKVLLADPLARVADWAFQGDPTALTLSYAWLGIVCYALQIFLDFSGYSDMAIGLGRMFGFEFVENFSQPYTAVSITDFWHRWHISLSNWMREYLYIPLGGNRLGSLRTYLNLWIVFLLSGLWHGANWTFIAWGAFHGTFLVLERLRSQMRVDAPIPKGTRIRKRAVTFMLILVSWVLFRADSLTHATGYLTAMLGLGSGIRDPLLIEVLNFKTSIILGIAIAISFTSRKKDGVWSHFRIRSADDVSTPQTALNAETLFIFSTGALLCFLASVLALTNSTFHPFIYFRF